MNNTTEEIERRWRTSKTEFETKLAGRVLSSAHIEQRFTDISDGSYTRLRRYNGQQVIERTTKTGKGLVRTEFTELVNLEGSVSALWEANSGLVITKTRHTLRASAVGLSDLIVDVFTGGLEGLYILEAEFESVESAHKFELPFRLKAQEVTGRLIYNNAQLAQTNQIPTTT